MFVLSIPILVVGIWIGNKEQGECSGTDTGAGTPLIIAAVLLIIAGGLLMCVAMVGLILNIVTTTRKCCFWFCLYVFPMVVFLIFGLGTTIFILTVSSKGSSIKLDGKGYHEYKLGSYSEFLQVFIKDAHTWNSTKSCLIKSDVCTKLNDKYLNDSVEKFYKEPLTAIQSGCCKPSDDCGFTYSSPANWSDEIGVSDKNPDCKAWDNDPKVKCFNCESCKGAVADNMKNAYKKSGIVSIVFCVLLVIVFVAYLFLRNINSAEDDNRNMTFDRNFYRPT
ncbi:Tetraspanin/Peripherin [Corchorus capsularis]|uniref:Tetraspanin/Peripherin n=1 Tax=Corchorus capsularis TaxID=210143 RepID=A0A1R3HGU3_COCAP|nr:Tetraspanin/Peripherin [Corchorus capsularis]